MQDEASDRGRDMLIVIKALSLMEAVSSQGDLKAREWN